MACECRVYQLEGICWHTGKQQTDVPAYAYRQVSRDHGLERDLLAAATELLSRQHAEQPGQFVRTVLEGLAVGDDKFGGRFLERDNLAEAHEEARDAAAYVLLELQRLSPALTDDGFQELRMATISALVAAMHLHAQIVAFENARASV